MCSALVLVRDKITMSASVQPACEPSLTDYSSSVGAVSGWGRTNANQTATREFTSKHLHKQQPYFRVNFKAKRES